VTPLHISELSEMSGVPTSTLRYYERIGLVRPTGRAGNGYRLYDGATLERLAFIGRAKRLGMNLDEVAALVEAWVAGDCEPVQEQLRAFVEGRLADLRRQIADNTAFERQLERILSRLETAKPTAGACRPDCGCDTDPNEVTDGDEQVAATCSLSSDARHDRIAEWQDVLAMATRVDRHTEKTVAVFDSSETLTGRLAALCAAETVCCPSLTFTMEIAPASLTVTMGGGPGKLRPLGLSPAVIADTDTRLVDRDKVFVGAVASAPPLGGGPASASVHVTVRNDPAPGSHP
jgi:DNA-binding transcriptional MerR regulator